MKQDHTFMLLVTENLTLSIQFNLTFARSQDQVKVKAVITFVALACPTGATTLAVWRAKRNIFKKN